MHLCNASTVSIVRKAVCLHAKSSFVHGMYGYIAGLEAAAVILQDRLRDWAQLSFFTYCESTNGNEPNQS